MANPQEQLAAWQKATLESTLSYAQASPGPRIARAMDKLNRAAKQFAELSEANIKAATAGMFKSGKK